MKINLKKLKDLENQYQENPVSLNTLQTMVNIVLDSTLSSSSTTSAALLAFSTLKALKVLDDETPKKIEQLNS